MLVTINCDMGEGFGLYQMGDDQALMPFIDMANIACGFHASDPMIMLQTVRLAKKYDVRVGAHPSLPDLQGFGRREMKISPDELTAILIYQVGALIGFLRSESMVLNHIKPHGALYGMAAKDEDIADVICNVAEIFDVPVVGMPDSKQEARCKARGIPMISEFFVDLDYSAEGKLIITRTHSACDPEVAAKRALRAVKASVVRSIDGTDVRVRAETLCIHSDTPNALDIIQAVVRHLGPHLNARNESDRGVEKPF